MITRRQLGITFPALAGWAIICLGAVFAALPAKAQLVTTLIQFTNVWKYDQSGRELGTSWRTSNYDDSEWPLGRGLLGFEDILAPYNQQAPLLTPLTISPAVTTFYFRTTFVWNGSMEGLSLFATNLVDDGCAIYLNGLRVGGVRAPAVFNANSFFVGGTEGQLETLSLTNLSALRQGLNLLAAEVHQSANTSADVMFGMKLVAVNETLLVVTNQPQSQTAIVGDPITLRVGVSGRPVTYRWQKDGVNLSSTSNSLNIASAQLGNSGNYHVICSNSINVVTSSVATLTVFSDRSGPQVLAAIAERPEFGPRTINILFSENLTVASVRNTNNYAVTRLGTTDTVTITNVLYSVALGALLLLDVNDPDWIPYADYLVTINNVTDTKTNAIAPNTTAPVAWAYTTNLLQASHCWDFHVSSIFDPGVFDEPWFACDYTPGPWWGQGGGPFYGGVILNFPCSTLGSPQTPTGWQPEPILYRTTFSYPANWPSSATLRLRTAFDDGLVLYLNGVEIYRNNVPGAAGSLVNANTRSILAPNPVSCLTNISIAVTNLYPGSNCLAAAVVQFGSGTGDADSYFVLEMDVTVLFAPALPPEPLPVLEVTPFDADSIRLSWIGGGYALESSTNLDLGPASYPTGPWTPVPQLSNPYLWNLTNSPARFFRLKK